MGVGVLDFCKNCLFETSTRDKKQGDLNEDQTGELRKDAVKGGDKSRKEARLTPFWMTSLFLKHLKIFLFYSALIFGKCRRKEPERDRRNGLVCFFFFSVYRVQGEKKVKGSFPARTSFVIWCNQHFLFFLYRGEKTHTKKTLTKSWNKNYRNTKNIHTLLTHTDNADKHTVYHFLQLWCYCSAVTLAGVISATTLHGQIWLHLFSQEGVIRKQQCMALNIRFIYKNVSFRGFSFNYQDKIFLILLIWRKES